MRKDRYGGHLLLSQSISTHAAYLKLLYRLLGEKRQELLDQANKLRTGLFKIDETREKVEVMSLELEDAKKKVAEFQKQCEEYLVIIVQQKREADEQQKVRGPAPVPLCQGPQDEASWPHQLPPPHLFLGFLSILLIGPVAPAFAQDKDKVLYLLFISRQSLPTVRRLLLRKSSVRHWQTMPRRI